MECTGSGQDGNLNISDCTDSEGTEISNKYRIKKKRQNEQNDNTSDCKNKNPTRRDNKGTWIDSDSGSDVEEVCHNSTTSKVKNVIVDSDFETAEISLSSLSQEGKSSDAKKSMTNGSFRNFLFDSDSENEDMGVRAQESKYRSKRVLSGSDTDSDGTELQHADEETTGAICVQKHKRRIIVSDEEDD